MINYELAKKLKDAGFPQGLEHQFVKSKNDTEWYIWNRTDISEFETPNTIVSGISCPTLSELIEACGEEFLSLDSPRVDGIGEWCAVGTLGENQLYREANGQTPEEAVANLWLALNKK